MKRIATLLVMTALVALAGCNAGEKKAQEEVKLDTDIQRSSYGIGYQVGSQLGNTAMKVDAAAVVLGVKDALEDKELRLTQEEIQEAMQTMQEEAMAEQKERMESMLAENKKAGEAFLEEFKVEEGVKELQDGIMYKVIREGEGESPTAEDTVIVDYEATLVNGTTVDSSYERDRRATFPLEGVINGWSVALQEMKAGGKWQIVIPAEQAYGEKGAGPIPPGSVMIFDVELHEIQKPGAKQKEEDAQ